MNRIYLLTLESDRGRGLASALIAYAAVEMKHAGRLYAYVWHSNLLSIRAFERAGCRRNEVQLSGAGPTIRMLRSCQECYTA